MEQNFYDCIDCGTENCPCYLAATGDCLVCSRLAGKDYCDCNWKGVCIYNEFIQSGKKIIMYGKSLRQKLRRISATGRIRSYSCLMSAAALH